MPRQTAVADSSYVSMLATGPELGISAVECLHVSATISVIARTYFLQLTP